MRTIIGLFAALFLLTGLAFGQEAMPSQASLQFTALFNTDAVSSPSATGNTLTDHATGSAGVRLSYAHKFRPRLSLEAAYGYSKDRQLYMSASTAPSGSVETAAVRTTVNQYTAAVIYRLPFDMAKVHPYVLGGTGAMQFRPSGSPTNPATSAPENRGVLVYGAGASMDLNAHMGLKAEFRGFMYTAPDFAITTLTTSSWTHLAVPSVGAFYRF